MPDFSSVSFVSSPSEVLGDVSFCDFLPMDCLEGFLCEPFSFMLPFGFFEGGFEVSGWYGGGVLGGGELENSGVGAGDELDGSGVGGGT